MDSSFDALVIGCGSAGTTAAKRLRADGRTVAVIEQDKVGGDCPHRACVPTKALLRSAQVYSLLRRAGEFGLRAGDIAFDWARIMARKEDVIRRTGSEKAGEGLERQGIVLLKGEAAFEDEHHVRVGGRVLRGERILIATGSRPALPDIPGLEEAVPITSVEAVSLSALPASLIVLGGGPVGCELAQLFSTFGVKVVLVHRGEALLPREEPELARIVQEALEENGVTVLTGAEVEQLGKEAGQKKVRVKVRGQVRELAAEEVLAATGREADTNRLNLAAGGMGSERGRIHIDEHLRTSRPHIYAAGDVCGPFLYTHFAHYQGRVAATNMFADEPAAADYRVVPRVTFTEPPLAGVGLTEEQARRAGHDVACATIEVGVLGKALVESESRGLVKLVADARSGAILGGHIAGPEAGEVIHEVVAAMAAGATVRHLAEAIHAFPNFAEGVKAAARKWMADVYDRRPPSSSA
jgi:pyruvate/2-oxoglutarate dehydrogenase complex dihydrolipoamide dehydrogenase (E3) component